MRLGLQLPRPTRTLLLGAVALALALTACGDDDDDEAASSATTASTADAPDGEAPDDDTAGAATIEAKDFALTSITVAPGAEVEVVNGDGAAHTVTSDDDLFDSGSVAGGETGTFTAPSEPGEHAFHCEIHPSMTGTLTVEG